MATLAPAICCLVFSRIKFSKLSIAFLASLVAFWAQNPLFTEELFLTLGFFLGGVCKRSIFYRQCSVKTEASQQTYFATRAQSTELQTHTIYILAQVLSYFGRSTLCKFIPVGSARTYTFDYKQRKRWSLFINIWFDNSRLGAQIRAVLVDQWNSY